MEKSNKYKQQNLVMIFAACLLSILLAHHPAWSADSNKTEITIDTQSGQTINLMVNKLAKLKSPAVIKRAYIVNPKIAELIYSKSQSPRWVFVSGKAVGSTQLTLWGNGNELLGTFEIMVSPDVAGLKKSLYEIFPEENVSVRSSGDRTTLTGTVSGAMKMKEVLLLAESFNKDKIVNLLQVGGIQQVMLEVRIAEISKSVGNQLGINFSWQGNSGFGLSLLDGLTAIPKEGWPGNPLLLSNAVNASVGFLRGDPIIVAIDALQEDGLLQILAKPTLIAQSGQSASFLAGGEFPYPVPQGLDRVTIDWKSFGVSLNFTPTVLGNDTISMVVAPEVSDLNYTQAISYAGFIIPSIDTRRMSTVVELKDNQSFAIAGLLKNNVRESVNKFPVLGDIPILGALFRSTKFQKEETELVVIVTPHLVKPIDADKMPLPTDSFEEPSPAEFLLLGRLEKGQETNTEAGKYPEEKGSNPVLKGDVEYIIPD